MFDSNGRIVMIYIVSENTSERIYKRDYQKSGSGAGHAEASESTELDLAAGEMKQAVREQIPTAAGMFYHDPMQTEFKFSDITEDGN